MNEGAPTRRRGRPPSTEAPPGDTRGRILRTAIDLFAQHGFHGTGVAEIGARADVQRGALYYHIGSKEELLWLILHDYTQLMLTDAERIVASDEPPTSKLRSLIHSHVRLIVEHQREVAIQLRDVGALTGERGAQLQGMRERIQDCWQHVIDAGHATGALRAHDHVITNGLLGMLNTVALWYRPHGDHSPDQIADTLAATVLDGLANPHSKG